MIRAVIRNAIAPAQPMGWTEAMALSVIALAAAALVAAPTVVALYLMKSAVGINIMAGPSPLHDVLYAYVR